MSDLEGTGYDNGYQDGYDDGYRDGYDDAEASMSVDVDELQREAGKWRELARGLAAVLDQVKTIDYGYCGACNSDGAQNHEEGCIVVAALSRFKDATKGE